MSQMDDESLETFYTSDDPNIPALAKEYNDDVLDLSAHVEQCQDAYDQRWCYWPGKTSNLKKEGPDAKPWEGASDQEVHLVEQCISTYVALMGNAAQRSSIRCKPVEGGDIRKSKILSSFVKWLSDTGIDGFERQSEIADNYLLEKGLAVTYVGWDSKNIPLKQTVDLEQLAEVAPEIAEMLSDESREDEAVAMFQELFDNVNEKRAKKALKELRQKGVAEIPYVEEAISRPIVRTRATDSDIIFPSYVMDLQESPRIHMRALMTPQQIENMVATQGWDKDWAEEVIENYRGVTSSEFEGPKFNHDRPSVHRVASDFGGGSLDADDIVEVIYTFRRLIDEEDGAEGIYLTVWHSQYDEAFAKHELYWSANVYPFVCTKLFDSHKRLTDLHTMSDLLRGPQRQAKTIRDGWTDQHSLKVAPPFLHPVGRAPDTFGAGSWIGVRPTDRYEFLQVPGDIRTDTQIEEFVLSEALDLVGLNGDNPLSPKRQQFFINKALRHRRDILKMAYMMHVEFGDDEMEFRVTGQPDGVKLDASVLDTEIDVSITYDTLMSDPDVVEKRINMLLQMMQSDPSGRFDVDAILEIATNSIDPSWADAVLRPLDASRQEVRRKVAEDLSLVWSGNSVDARPNGAQIALDYIQNEYVQKPNVLQRLREDPVFAQDLDKYVSQYEFQIQQNVVNAQTGRIGTAPAAIESETA